MGFTGRKNQKCLTGSTEELNISNGIKVTLRTVNIEKPDVIEINMSCFAVPSQTLDTSEYESSILNIERKFKSIIKEYVRNHHDIILDKYITDFNFTSSKLKKGYKKKVSMSVYVKQKNTCTFNNVASKFKNTLIDPVTNIEFKIFDENFSCLKEKN